MPSRQSLIANAITDNFARRQSRLRFIESKAFTSSLFKLYVFK